MQNNFGRYISILLLAFGLCSPVLAGASSGQNADPLRAQAEQGDPVAQDRLGFLYYNGNKLVPHDYAEAQKWFRKAAEQGNASAQNHLGTMYYVGRGVPRDYAEAAKWFQKAAEQGDEHAERQLAEMYALGLGVPRDHAESEKWSKKVAAQNPPPKTTGLIFHSRFWLIEISLTLIAFVCGLVILQKETLAKWKRLLIAPFVHLIGVVLVLNSVNTYGFQLFFPKCRGNDLTTSCYQYHFSDRVTHFLKVLGDLQIENLLFRFMMIMGFALDILAILYLVYLYRRLFRRGVRERSNASSGLNRVPGAV